jgi:hypothetical protein
MTFHSHVPKMRHVLVMLTIFVSAVLIANSAVAESQYAITKTRLNGSKGTIRLTQILFLPAFMKRRECEDVLPSIKQASRLGGVYEQECVANLPNDLVSARDRLPVDSGYLIAYTDSPFLLPELKVADIYYYEFDAGSPNDVCERALAHYRKRDKSAVCVPPRPANAKAP